MAILLLLNGTYTSHEKCQIDKILATLLGCKSNLEEYLESRDFGILSNKNNIKISNNAGNHVKTRINKINK